MGTQTETNCLRDRLIHSVCSAEIFDPDFEITSHVSLVNMKSADLMKQP